jgi:hypothetical protein
VIKVNGNDIKEKGGVRGRRGRGKGNNRREDRRDMRGEK